MSHQVNFFADTEDSERLHGKLFEEFPGLMAIPTEPAFEQDLHAHPAQELMSAQRMYLVPPWAVNRIVLRPVSDGRLWVDQKASPVLEYRRSVLNADTETITVGRFYWAFEGSIRADEARQIGRMLRWVKKQTVATPDRRFRVFEAAARKRRVLDYGFGITERSPQWRT